MRVQITPWELGRFWVNSSRPGVLPYLVDMLEYKRNGQCNCDHFRIRIQTRLEEGLPVEVCTCKHIEAVKRFIARCALQQMWEPPKRLSSALVEYIVPRVLFNLARLETPLNRKIITYGKARSVDKASQVPKGSEGEFKANPPAKPYFLDPAKAYARGR